MITVTISGSGFWSSEEAQYESSLEHASLHERYLENDPLFAGEYIAR